MHPAHEMLPEEIRGEVTGQGGESGVSRWAPKSQKKEDGREIDPSDLIVESLEEKSAWGMPGKYEVPDA